MPKQNSSGGKDRLGSISKQGDRYLRSLFTAGALAVIRYAKIHGVGHRPWLTGLLARRPTKVAAIALAYKLAYERKACYAQGMPSRARRLFRGRRNARATLRDALHRWKPGETATGQRWPIQRSGDNLQQQAAASSTFFAAGSWIDL